MSTKEIFPYDIEEGTVMDFVDGRFMLVIKDSSWSPEEVSLLQAGCTLQFCYTADIAIFIFEGGDIDSSDFYFNIQDCEQKEQLLALDLPDVELLLVNAENEICWKKRKTLSAAHADKILACLRRQNEVQFMPGEFEVNVDGIQSAYEPFELGKYAVCVIPF